MHKIFAKTLKTLYNLWTFKPSQAKSIRTSFQNWDPSLFFLYDVKLQGKKIEKADDQEILHCRQMGKGTKRNWSDTPAKGVQLIFAPHRWYRISVGAWWYYLVNLWIKLFVSQGLIQACFGLFDGHRIICRNAALNVYQLSYLKDGGKVFIRKEV